MSVHVNDLERARAALACIPADLPREQWARVGMACKAAGLDFADWDAWSQQGASYRAADARDTWRSIRADGGVTAATLFHVAREHGHHVDKPQQKSPSKAPSRPVAAIRQPAAGQGAAEVWARCEPATPMHGYCARKGLSGEPLAGLGQLPQGDPLRIAGQSVAGWLVVPVHGPDGELQSLQFIPPGTGKKLNLPGASIAGVRHIVGEAQPGQPVYLAEGIASAWSCWQATGRAAVCCFGWGNVARVAADLRQRDASARLVLVPDVGQEAGADAIALELGALVAKLPEGLPSNTDANDYMQAEDGDALATLLESASEPPPPALPLSVVFADELPAQFTPPDELVQGILAAGDASVLYGDSNSGKTFAAVDMACAVARGVPWLGRNTEQGLVVYLAAESPASVRRRLQAYQQHHGVRVPDFAIVQSPVDLFASDADADAVVHVVQHLSALRDKPARLVIGDTLARLSAGANENSGEDMGRVVQRIDAIRAATGAHFLLIHHSGKNAAAGARGWSGIRAAVDTEIEVTDAPQGRCLEVTKQRDVGAKGERIGFRLEAVALGLTKWDTPATSCIVVPADAPAKPQGKRVSEVGGAILEHLRTQPAGVKKREVVVHFAELYDKSSVYRELKRLVEAGQVHESAGIVAAALEVRKGAN